jgi:RHS repeat-associated protein
LSSVTDANGTTIIYRYDDFGRLELLTSANLAQTGDASFSYDARGNVLVRTLGDATVTQSYDGLDRVQSTSAHSAVDPGSVAYQYLYDENGFAGLLTSVVEADRTTTYSYDWGGRLHSETVAEPGVPVSVSTSFDYDPAGALRTLTYPSGLRILYARDPATGAVTAVSNADTGLVYASNIAWMPGGPVSSLQLANGRTVEQVVNLRYEPLAIHSGPLWLQYTPTPAGDIGQVTDQSEDPSGCIHDATRSLTYDLNDRVTTFSDSVQSGVGICGTDASAGSRGVFTYVPGTDQISSQLTPDLSGHRVVAFAYDYRGNISGIGQYDASGVSIQEAICLRHDPLNRVSLVGSTSPTFGPGSLACTRDIDVTTISAQFRYDASGKRIARQTQGQWTYFFFDRSGSPLSEMSFIGGSWRSARDYIWLDGRLLAQVEYAGSPSTYFAHVDHIGSPRLLSNANGQPVWFARGEPFADMNETSITDPLSGRPVVTNLRLPGQYDERLLGSVGLQGPYYNWNRWYLPGIGRYVELDPAAAAGRFNKMWGVDWYGYAGQNPLRRFDRTGLTEHDYQDCVWACELAYAGCLIAGVAVCSLTGPAIPYCYVHAGVCCTLAEQVCERNCEKKRYQ